MFPSLYDQNENSDVDNYINDNQQSLRLRFSSKIETIEKTLEVVYAGVLEAKKQKNKPCEHTWNFAGYINIVSLDLAVAGEALMFEKNQWKKRYHSRMASVNIYEACLDIPNMTGKDFRSEVAKLHGGDEFLKSLGQVTKKIKKFQSDNAAWLKKIRLCCSAHRNQNLDTQLKVVFNISPTKALKLMADFDVLLNEFGKVSQIGISLLPSNKIA